MAKRGFSRAALAETLRVAPAATYDVSARDFGEPGGHLGNLGRMEAEAAFLAASVAVWREIDRLDAEPEGYHPVRMSVELRKAERAAWERYRDVLDATSG